MSVSYYMEHCKRCHSAQQFLRPKTSHVLHLLISLMTVGVWIPIWFLLAANHSTRAQCTRCGNSPSGLSWGLVLGVVVLGLILIGSIAA